MVFPTDVLNDRLEQLSSHPFYRGRIPLRVIDEEDFAANVPLMRRADLVREMQQPGYGSFGGARPVRVNFSPMDGTLIPVMQSSGDLDAMIGAARSHLDACGIGPGDICAVTFGYHLFVAGLFYQSQMEAHGVACIPLGPGETERAVELCSRHGVTVLAGNPSFVLRMMDQGLPAPRVFFAGGEAFSGNTTLYQAVREAMPQTVLVDSFSLSEFLPVGRTFPGGDGVHVFDELVHAEVIDPHTGECVPDGERGELVLTHLQKEAQPLLRYRTGDLTIRQITEPVCGRRINLPRVVFGRTDSMVKVRGVKLYPSEIGTLLLGIEGLTRRFLLKVSGRPGGRERLSLILEGTGSGTTTETVALRFKSRMLVTVDEVRLVERLEDGPMVLDERNRDTPDG